MNTHTTIASITKLNTTSLI